MGDRVLVVFAGKGGRSPALYGHYIGGGIVDVLSGAQSSMRKHDPNYCLARATFALCSAIPGVLGVGVLDGPADLKPATLEKFSHGDAGVLVVDVDTGKMKAHGGYLAGKRLPTLNLALA